MAKAETNNSGGKLASFKASLWNSKRRELLGRDGAGWAKLGIFYFFFYVGLAGFFCSMLAVFMALSPRDHPRYVSESSRMTTRSHPLSPGLGFRPQPDSGLNVIIADKGKNSTENVRFTTSIDQYLKVYYWSEKRPNDDGQDSNLEKKFAIAKPGDCTSNKQYGFNKGQPCVLVKMNKIVDFKPEPGFHPDDKNVSQKVNCAQDTNAVALSCYGEYLADVDNIGDLRYISEDRTDNNCGYLATNWFPYRGKHNRMDFYQAPYIWVQFLNPKPNVLINVICRVFGKNIEFDRKTGRALTRFQIYVRDVPMKTSSNVKDDI